MQLKYKIKCNQIRWTWTYNFITWCDRYQIMIIRPSWIQNWSNCLPPAKMQRKIQKLSKIAVLPLPCHLKMVLSTVYLLAGAILGTPGPPPNLARSVQSPVSSWHKVAASGEDANTARSKILKDQKIQKDSKSVSLRVRLFWHQWSVFLIQTRCCMITAPFATVQRDAKCCS